MIAINISGLDWTGIVKKNAELIFGSYVKTGKNALRQTDSDAKESGIQCHHDQPHWLRHSPLEGDDGEDDSDEHEEEHPNLTSNAG